MLDENGKPNTHHSHYIHRHGAVVAIKEDAADGANGIACIHHEAFKG